MNKHGTFCPALFRRKTYCETVIAVTLILKGKALALYSSHDGDADELASVVVGKCFVQ